MRQWKIALSLAIVGALAAPFAFGTYYERPTYSVWVPLTAQEKETLANILRRNDCDRDDFLTIGCLTTGEALEEFKRSTKEILERGTTEQRHFDLAGYLAMNVVTAAATAVILYLLAYLIPMLFRGIASLARRYWNWLNA